jgi:hypothetical protein
MGTDPAAPAGQRLAFRFFPAARPAFGCRFVFAGFVFARLAFGRFAFVRLPVVALAAGRDALVRRLAGAASPVMAPAVFASSCPAAFSPAGTALA